ncbi:MULTISPECIES: protease modulator HflC [Pandoraea]|uniref:Protein HflC n=2 Tax=Pandoraea TaxID=93217 RepID=A0A239SM98_9BURK|nr:MULTISPECIES: protease modulator HflC [Pandoraea]AJC17467.1 HflC protein [Pandoraea sputorum]SNU85803.1 Modulator of FtsH protease HflC [Pandoraea sputorum]VVD98806.1 Modulator of FtsH protease HflC [Pandoraea sputorum]VVE67718.1 Modulator of FtsH protease HflC [Pandoraea anapnoica]VVE79845.1 Modulator of FtsH protease HflC [Pandoraea sputorum]
MNRIGTVIVALIVLLIVLASTMFVVDQRRYAVVFSLGEIKDVYNQPGLKFKLPPPLQTVLYLDKRIMTIDNPEPERFITAEKKNLIVDSYVKWRIIDPRKFYVSFKGDNRLAQDRLTQQIRSALQEAFTKRTVTEVVSTQRDQVMQWVKQKVGDEAAQVGIEIVDVRMRRVDLAAGISDSVYSRMAAERKRVANELRSTGAAEAEQIRADADRQRDVVVAEAYAKAQQVKGEGDAVAAGIYAQAFGRDPQFAQFYQSLEAYKATFRDKKDVIIADPNSDFFRFMRGSGGAGASAGKAGK